jgi:glycosyltransferase 2 family protein
LKRLLITLLKVGVSAAILGYLVYDATQTKGEDGRNVFLSLLDQQKRWDLLAAAWACCTVAVLLTFFRWWYLVRTLGIPFRLSDSIRISFWGYLLNLAPLGIVGGDLAKTVMLDHEYPRNRAKALASVLVDRVIGLYVLFLVASVAILATRFWQNNNPDIFRICMAAFAITVASTIGLGIVLGPEAIIGWMIRIVARIPRVGKPLESLIHAVRMYRKPRVLIISAIMTVGVHCLFATGCYLTACGLFDQHLTNLSLSRHFVVIPLGAAMQVIPLPVGPTEAALFYLYPTVHLQGPPVTKAQGFLVALVVYRFMTLLIASLGLPYYFRNRREMAEVMHEAEEETNSP